PHLSSLKQGTQSFISEFSSGVVALMETEAQAVVAKRSSASRFRRVCVFCGSSPGKKASYQLAATQLGHELVSSSIVLYVQRNIDLVYGGGSVGLMGLVSQAVHDGGRHVLGSLLLSLSLSLSLSHSLSCTHVFWICCRVIPRTLMPREVCLPVSYYFLLLWK
ncbi:hypothetical protein GW17_00047172, partial [Ensete ventricosum]